MVGGRRCDKLAGLTGVKASQTKSEQVKPCQTKMDQNFVPEAGRGAAVFSENASGSRLFEVNWGEKHWMANQWCRVVPLNTGSFRKAFTGRMNEINKSRGFDLRGMVRMVQRFLGVFCASDCGGGMKELLRVGMACAKGCHAAFKARCETGRA